MEREFIRQLIADPDDNQLRRVYADWMIDQGREQGDLVHTQLDLLELSPDDDLWWTKKAMEARLLSANAVKWSQRICQVARRAHFSRGFPERVVIEGRKLMEAPAALLDNFPVWMLRVTNLRQWLKDLAAAPWLSKLRGLSLRHNRMSAAVMKNFAKMARLYEVRELDLTGGYVDAEVVELMRTQVPRLEHIELDSASNAAAMLADWPQFQQLRTLRLHHGGPMGFSKLGGSPFLPNKLQLRFDVCDRRDLDAIGPSKLAAQIESLEVSHGLPAFELADALNEHRGISNVRRLSLGNFGRLDEQAVKLLVDCPQLAKLTHLQIGTQWHGQMRVDQKAMELLFQTGMLHEVRELTVRGIGDPEQGAILLHCLVRAPLPKLRSLTLLNVQATNDAETALKKCPLIEQLEIVHI